MKDSPAPASVQTTPNPEDHRPGEISIRPLRNEGEAQFCADFIVVSDPWRTLGLTKEQTLLRLMDPAREVHLATIDHKIGGVLILHLSGPLNGYIQLVAVHPELRRRGIGTKLISWAEDRILKLSPNVFLCVSDFNLEARKLYERMGYKQVGELPDFLVNGRAEILMRKTDGPWLRFLPAT